jgi:hypothetical protein
MNPTTPRDAEVQRTADLISLRIQRLMDEARTHQQFLAAYRAALQEN